MSRDPTNFVTLNIPRAYIVFANGYSYQKKREIPDRIETHRISLRLTYPDGKPTTLHVQELGYAPSECRKARDALRPVEYVVSLSYVTPGRDAFAPFQEIAKRRPLQESSEEFEVHFDGIFYFIPKNQKLISFIYCLNNSKPNYTCDHYLHPTASLAVKAAFVDFRFHGGAEFVRERAERLRDLLCAKFLACAS